MALYQHGFEASRKFSYFLPQNNKLANHFCEHSDTFRQSKTGGHGSITGTKMFTYSTMSTKIDCNYNILGCFPGY